MNPGYALVGVGLVLILRGGTASTLVGGVLVAAAVIVFGDVQR